MNTLEKTDPKELIMKFFSPYEISLLSLKAKVSKISGGGGLFSVFKKNWGEVNRFFREIKALSLILD